MIEHFQNLEWERKMEQLINETENLFEFITAKVRAQQNQLEIF